MGLFFFSGETMNRTRTIIIHMYIKKLSIGGDGPCRTEKNMDIDSSYIVCLVENKL